MKDAFIVIARCIAALTAAGLVLIGAVGFGANAKQAFGLIIDGVPWLTHPLAAPVISLLGVLVLLVTIAPERVVRWVMREPVLKARVVSGKASAVLSGGIARLAVRNVGGKTARGCSGTVNRLWQMRTDPVEQANTELHFSPFVPFGLTWTDPDTDGQWRAILPNGGGERYLRIAAPRQRLPAGGTAFEFIENAQGLGCGSGWYRATILVSSDDDRAARLRLEVVLTMRRTEQGAPYVDIVEWNKETRREIERGVRELERVWAEQGTQPAFMSLVQSGTHGMFAASVKLNDRANDTSQDGGGGKKSGQSLVQQ